jgi:splicing factor 4
MAAPKLSFALAKAKPRAPVVAAFAADSDKEDEPASNKRPKLSTTGGPAAAPGAPPPPGAPRQQRAHAVRASACGALTRCMPPLPRGRAARPADDVALVAERLAEFVAKNGRQFEEMTRARNPGDTPFKCVEDGPVLNCRLRALEP